MPEFPFTEVKSLQRWTNYSGTIPERSVPIYCTPDVFGSTGSAAPRKLRRNGDALKAILTHCFETPGMTLRAIGSRWSFSRIVEPGQLIVDPANLNAIFEVNADWLTADYKARRRPGFKPMFVQGGTHVASINRRFLQRGLALQTSGAGDGHRFAGCIATGTHGSALHVGAVHDTVQGFHLITAPDQSIFVQSRSHPVCDDAVIEWLRRETGLFVTRVDDDELFAAAQVSLGSLGFVHGVVVEAEPIYSLRRRIVNRSFGDPEVWDALTDLDTKRFHSDIAEDPFHFEVVFNPHPIEGRPGAFVKLFWKEPGDAAPHDSPMPVAPDMASDNMGLIASISDGLDGPLSSLAVRLLIADQLERRYKPGDRAPQVPGMVFGPSGLPPGHGASTEVAVEVSKTRKALEALYAILLREGARGRHLLGAVAVRFVPKTSSLLGLNIHARNAYIELPSIRNAEVLDIYRQWWDALEAERIPFACHWGQLHGMNPQRLQSYFGDRAQRWRAARDRIVLDDVGKRVFSSPLLAEVGLD